MTQCKPLMHMYTDQLLTHIPHKLFISETDATLNSPP